MKMETGIAAINAFFLCSGLLATQTTELFLCSSDFELLGNEGCKSVWHQLRASEGGQMLQGIEYESLSANLILENDLLFSFSEKRKLHGTEINWRVCVDVVEEAMTRNPIKVLCAFYIALIATKDSGGATQHAKIAERLAIRRCLSTHACGPLHHICASIILYIYNYIYICTHVWVVHACTQRIRYV